MKLALILAYCFGVEKYAKSEQHNEAILAFVDISFSLWMLSEFILLISNIK